LLGRVRKIITPKHRVRPGYQQPSNGEKTEFRRSPEMPSEHPTDQRNHCVSSGYRSADSHIRTEPHPAYPLLQQDAPISGGKKTDIRSGHRFRQIRRLSHPPPQIHKILQMTLMNRLVKKLSLTDRISTSSLKQNISMSIRNVAISLVRFRG
jgi:hypothetical protein